MTTLTACGGGGGGIALVAGGVGGGAAAGGGGGGGAGLLGGMLLKGPITGALVFQDIDGSGTFDFTDANGDGVFDPAVDVALEPYAYSDATGAFSLQTINNTAPILTSGGIDTTTGASAGQFRFGPGDNLDTVTPVSAVMSKVNGSVAAGQVFTKLSEAGIAVDLNNYNPISSAAEAGGADATAAAVDALGAQMQATINALSAMLEGVSDINSADPHSDAVDAMIAAINSAGAAGTSIDFGSVADVTSILNQSALGSGGYVAAVASVSQALAEVNKQLYELFTEEDSDGNSGDFLDADARGMALMAQTDLIDAISEFADTPSSEDAAGSLEARFDLVDDSGNPTALFESYKAEFKDKVPDFDPVSGAPNLLASTDSLSLQKGATSGALNPLANDISISGFADSQLTVLGVATTRKGEPTNVTAQSSDDILETSSDHGLTSGELISVDTGGGSYAEKYAGVIDSNNFVIFDDKAEAQSFSIDSAVAVSNAAAEVLTVDGASFDDSTNLFARVGHGFVDNQAVTLLVEGADGSLESAGEFTVDMSRGDADNFGLSGDALPDLADAAAVGFIAKTGLGALSGLDAGAVLYFDQAHGLADGDTVTILDGAGPFTPGAEQAITLVNGSGDLFQIAGIDAGSVPATTLNYIDLSGIGHMTSIADGELFFVKAAHGLASGANITELTGSTGSYGIGSGYTITADPQKANLFKVDGFTAANFTDNVLTFVATDGLYQTANTNTNLTVYNWLSNGSSISQNNVSLTINNDGTVSASVAANASAGTQTFFYKAFDPDGNVAVGPISVNVEPTKPTLAIAGVPTAIFEDVTDADLANPGVRSDASGDYLEIPIGSYFDTISLEGADPAGMSVMFTVMGLEDDAMRVIPGQSKNVGLAYRGDNEDVSPLLREDADGNVISNDRYVKIDEAGDLTKIKSDLVLRLSEDFSGAIDFDVYMTVTEGNRFASSKAEISFSVVARADIPTLTILDKAPDADSTAAEDTAVRLFKAENGDAILTTALTDTDGSETLSLVVEKQVTLADGSKVDGTFVNAATGQAMGVERTYTIDGTSTTVIEFTEAQFDNIAVLLPENYAGTADVVARARAVEGNNDDAFSTPVTINLETTPVADPVSVSLSNPEDGVEDTPFYVNFTASQGEADEDLSVFVGDFKRQIGVDENNKPIFQSVDLADIGGAFGFRPNVDFVTPFAEQTVDGDTAGYFQFSESAATTEFLNAGQIEFLPLADFNGSLSYKVFARSIETDGQMSESAAAEPVIQTFEARSEDPNVELGGNLTAAEYQGQGVTNYTSQKLGIGELQVDQADSLELMKATVTFTNADGDALVSKGNYVTLDETGVADMKASGAVEINMTSPGTYEVTGKPADGANAAVNLQSAMAKIGVVPPEDYSSSTSANSDITVGIQIQAKEFGANPSAPDGGSFTLSVTPVAGTPSVANSAGSARTGSEDQLVEIGNGLTFSTDDIDGSEAIVAVTISNIPEGFVVVDYDNNTIGVSDGAGSVTLTNLTATNADGTEYGFSSQVFLRAPTNFNGDLPDGALQVNAIAKEDGSGVSATSQTSLAVSVTYSAVADAPVVSVPSSDAVNPIRIGENTGGDDYSVIRLNASVVERNSGTDDTGYPEELSILIRLPHGSSGEKAVVAFGGLYETVGSGDPDYVAGSDTYRIDEANKEALQGATFKPPVGFAGENYNVTIIGRSTDGSDVANTTDTITYYIAPVAKAPIITKADGTILGDGDEFSIGEVDLHDGGGPDDNFFSFDITVVPVGDEQTSLILTGIPGGDFLSFENADGDAVGARNIDGTVYVISLSEIDLDELGEVGHGSIDDDEYLRLVVDNNYGTTENHGGIQGEELRQDGPYAGRAYFDKTIDTIDLTGFALDQVGGTTAQIKVSTTGSLRYSELLGGDPLIVDLAGDDELSSADFSQKIENFDINVDGYLDNVYMPVGTGIGLLVFDKDGDNFNNYTTSLSFKDHIFSEYFEFGGQSAMSSIEALSLLDDSKEDGSADGIIDENDVRFSDIYLWSDDGDGLIESNETQVITSANLNALVASNIEQTAGDAATVLRTASIVVAGQDRTLYEVALGHDLNKSQYDAPFEAETITINGGALTLDPEDEGLHATDRSVSFPIVFNDNDKLENGEVTLATVRGLPDQLSFNTGAKLDNGDWLFIKSDLLDDNNNPKDVQLIAIDENYSGDFVLSYWTVTSNPLTGDTAISDIGKAVGNIVPVADSANIFVVEDVLALEDAGRDENGRIDTEHGVDATTLSTPIPLSIFYALDDTDGSESAKLQLKIKANDIIHSDNSAALDLKLRYQEGEVKKELAYVSDPDDDSVFIFEIDNLATANDERVLSLELIPMADYATVSGGTLDIDAVIITTDGDDINDKEIKTISVVIEDLPDAIPIEFESAARLTDSNLSPTYQYDSSAAGTASVTSYEGIAADTGITLITSTSGFYGEIRNVDTGSALSVSDVQGLVITITSNEPADLRISEFLMVTSDGASIVPNNGGDTYTFAVPTLAANDTLRLVTPENYDGAFTAEIKSLVTVNGKSDLSAPITMEVNVFSDGTPADVRFGEAEAFEDGPAFRLPVNVTLTDKSESLTNIELTTDKASGPVILTRLGNTDLNGYKAAISDVNGLATSFDQPNPLLEGGPTLILRYASNFKASIADPSLADQIKAVVTEYSVPVQGLASIQTLFESFDLQQGRDWNFYVSGEVTEDGVAETRLEQVELVEGNLRGEKLDESVEKHDELTISGLNRAEFAETSISSDHITVSESENTFDIKFVDGSGEGAVLDIMPAKPGAEGEALDAWNSQFQLAQTWLAGRLGLKANEGVDASFDVGVKVFTRDLDNVDGAKASSVFSGRDTIASSHDNAENATVLNVTLRATNDLPVVTNISQAASYHQGGDHILIASEALISDIDTTNFAGGAVKAELATPVAGENLLFVGGVSDTAALTLEGNNIIDGASKIIGQVSYTASGGDNIAVKISLTEEAGIADVQAVLRGLAYRFDSDDATPFQTGTSAFTISVQDGAGVDVNGNIATTVSGGVVRTAQEANVTFTEGDAVASGEVGANEVGLFSSIDLDGSGTPTTVFVEVTDYRSGDLLSLDASVTGVSASYAVVGDDTQVGRLTLTLDATPASSAAAQSLFETALTNLHYSSSSDNPDQRLTDASHTIDGQRDIAIKVQDNSTTTDVTEARTAAVITVDIGAVDDAPVLNVDHFNAVETSITSEAAGVARTQILQGIYAFGATKYGTSFDPDSLIKSITIDLSYASDNTSQVDLARLQDRLSLDVSESRETTGFTVTSGADSSTLTLGLDDDVLETQTLAENQAQVEAALRSIYFENDSTLIDIVTGNRNVTISFTDDADVVHVVHDAEDAKLLVGSGEAGNVLPVISGITQAASFHEGADHVLLAADALVTDVNETNFAGGLIKIDLSAPAAGDNLILIDNAMVEAINDTAEGGRIVSASSPLTVLANFTKTISGDGDVTGLTINMAVPEDMADAVTATQFQAILRAVGYTFDDTNGASYATGNIAFDVVVQDGDGVDASGQINSFASGSVVKTARENAVTFTEGDAVASGEVGANEVGLFSSIDLDGSGTPTTVFVEVTDYRSGDLLSLDASVTGVSASYAVVGDDTQVGRLTLTLDATPASSAAAQSLFETALTNLHYSSSSDNPDQRLTDASHTIDGQRDIAIKVQDNSTTTDVTEARTAAVITVDIGAVDDAPVLNVDHFNAVETSITSEAAGVARTQILQGIYAFGATKYGTSFDPDSLIKSITIDLSYASDNTSQVDLARLQDRLSLDVSESRETTGFTVTSGADSSTLTLGLDDDVLETQTLAENQAQVEAALRSIYFENDSTLIDIVTGNRNVTISFTDDADVVHVVHDAEDAKLLVGSGEAGNVLPVISGITQAASFHEGADHVLLAADALVTDVNETNFAGGLIKIDLSAPAAGDNLILIDNAMVEAINDTAEGGRIVSASSPLTVLANFTKTISGDGDVTGLTINMAVPEDMADAVTATQFQAILRAVGYTFDDTNGASYATGNIAFDVVVQDGDGVDASGQINSFASGSVVKTARENAVTFTEGDAVASGEVGANEVGLFSSIDLDGSGTPTTVFVEVTDYRSGDLLSLDASVTGVSASYAVVGDDTQVGRLTLTLDATPASSAAAQSLFETALTNLHYSSSSDNPDQRLTDASHTIDGQRDIAIKVQDNSTTTDVTEARTAAVITVDIGAVDDAPVLNVDHFNAVETSITSEAAGVARTQILQGIYAFGATKYGTSFDPDSLIKSITIDLSYASDNTSQVDLARLQDRLSLDVSESRETTGFTVTSGADSSTLTLGLDDDVLETQTLAENQAQVEAALRSIYFENDSTLIDIVTGNRNVTISFTDDADVVHVVHDAEDAKLLVGSGEAGNVLPVISGITQAASFHEGADHVLLAADALVTDVNETNFAGGLIKIDLSAPAAGDNLILIDNAMVEAINDTAEGGRIVSASSPLTVLANFTKTISGDGDVTGLTINMAVPEDMADAVTATQFQAILRAVGYTFDDTNGASYATGNIAFDVVVQDGDGVDASGQINSFASGSVVKTARENAVTFTEGDAVASGEVGANEVGLFSSIDLTGSGAPTSIEVVVSDFRVGDILRTTSGDVGSSYDSATGVLTLTSPSGVTPAAQLTSFQSALNAVVYSNSSDNPLQDFTDADHTRDPQRLIEIRVTDNASTGDVSEARTVAKISVDITATDDAAELKINDFERVQIAPLDPDTGLPSDKLSVQPTQLLPGSLFDQPGTDAIASTIYGGTFDPDTLISKIKIDVTSVDESLASAALQQDELFLDAGRSSQTTSFAVSTGDETASLTLTLDVTGQTLAENQAQVEAALRSVYFKNYKPLAELVSGYRDVKITFNDEATAVYDSSLDQQLAKLLVGKALQPGDTHVGLNMAISADRLTSTEAIAEVIFTIETDSGTADLNDRLYILNDAGLIVEELEAGDLVDGKATFIWHPPSSLVASGNANGEIVSILKDQIGFGGQSIDQGGLRTIAVDIYDASHSVMGPAGLKATVFVQPDENDFVLAVADGVVTDVADTDAGDGDIVSFDGYAADSPLTIDLGLQKAIVTNDDQTATITDVAGFEKVVGSSRDDLIIAGGSGSLNIAGGQGDDTIAGGADDVADYGLEEVLGEHKPNYEASGIIADLQTGEVIDSYGDTDIIYRNENGTGIQNIVATSKDDIIVGSDQDNVIEAGGGDDLIRTGAGNDEVFGGLGDDRIVVGAGDDTLYGDSRHEAGGRDTFVFEGSFGTDRIEDFEAAAARPANYNLADTVWGPSLSGDQIIVRLDQGERLEGPVEEPDKIVLRKTRQDGQTHSVLVSNTAGLITATTIALVTSEVMAVGDLSSLNGLTASISLSREDVLDLSALTEDLVIDQGFSKIWEASNPYGMIDVQGYEQIVGGAGDDVLIAAGDDPFGLAGGAGHDQLYGGPDDILRYDMEEAYRSAVQATGVSVDLEAGTATDTFGDTDTLTGFDNVVGTTQDDVIFGSSGNNRIHGHEGNDLLDGRAGDDIIIGGDGQDIIIGGTGNDVLTGDGGNGQFADIFDFRGNAGSLSDFGHDVVTDFQIGLDTARLFLNGASTMTAGANSTSAITINAGAGSVQFNWDETIEAGISFEQLMSSVEEIRFLDTLVDIDASIAPQGKLESILQLSGIDVGTENGLFVDVAFQQIWDPDGALLDLDDFYEAAGFGTYLGSMGNDIIVGAAEASVGLAGGKGADLIVGSSLDTLRFDIEEEMETEALLGEALNRHHHHVEVNLGDGHIGLADLMIDGASVADAEIAAGSATDLWGDQDTIIGVENVVGSSGDDLLFGSAEENSIAGGAGDDLIYGGAGSDVLEGGYGADTFIYLSRDNAQSRDDIDMILDFDVSQDKLTFEGLGIEDMQVDVVDLDNSGKLDVMFTAVDAPDWGAVVLVDVGRLDAEEIIVSSEVAAA